MPTKVKKFTITKSPMAHKTFSQEQLKWTEYKLLMDYKLKLDRKIKNFNSFIYFNIKQKNKLKSFKPGTNLLVSKKIKVLVKFSEKNYFLFF